jgi:hypothetical protein
MSLQSNTSIWTWKATLTIRQSLYFAAVLALLLVLPCSYGQATAGTRTTLAVSHEGTGTTFTVTVKDPTGTAVTDGTVSLMTGGASLGSAIVNGDGTATLTVDKLPANTKQVTAVYSGSEHYAASSSASAAIQADATTPAPPDFSITANPASLTMKAGQYGTSILTIASENGFTQAVTLSISGLPGIGTTTTTFTPNIAIPPSNGSVTSTMQIQTTAPSTSSQAMLQDAKNHLAYAVVLPGLLALAGVGALRKRNGNVFRVMGVALLLLACGSGLTACSQRYSYLHHPPTPNTGTPTGTFPLTITAYSNNGGEVTSHSISFTLTVQ